MLVFQPYFIENGVGLCAHGVTKFKKFSSFWYQNFCDADLNF